MRVDDRPLVVRISACRSTRRRLLSRRFPLPLPRATPTLRHQGGTMKPKMGIAVAALATFSATAAEWVAVDKVANDSAVVSRQDGSSYLIEVGVG